MHRTLILLLHRTATGTHPNLGSRPLRRVNCAGTFNQSFPPSALYNNSPEYSSSNRAERQAPRQHEEGDASIDRRGRATLPIQEHGFALHKSAFRDALCLRYGLPSHCICGKSFTVEHALIYTRGEYPSIRHKTSCQFIMSNRRIFTTGVDECMFFSSSFFL